MIDAETSGSESRKSYPVAPTWEERYGQSEPLTVEQSFKQFDAMQAKLQEVLQKQSNKWTEIPQYSPKADEA